MKIRGWRSAFGVLSLWFVSAIALPIGPTWAQTPFPGCGMGPRGGGRGCEAPLPPSDDPAEQSAYDAFKKETLVEAEIRLGEQFDQRYPASRYQESVETQLVYLYYSRENWPSFYAVADRLLAKYPTNLAVLRLVGWVIPTIYDSKNPNGPAQLGKAEGYEKRVLAMIADRKKPKNMTDDEFLKEKVSDEWLAHSALGMIYFRRKDFAGSAKELEMATPQESGAPKAQDLYTLGLDLQNLNRTREATDAFTGCAENSSAQQELCTQAAADPAQEAAFYAFSHEPGLAAQIALGENFDKRFSASRYREVLHSILVGLYDDARNWERFYAMADQVIATDPDNVPVLTLVGWEIPRNYDANDPDGAAKLDKSEKYEKHALELIASLQPPADITSDQFDRVRAIESSQAHSGLGIAYFRRNDFARSAKELQIATTLTVEVDPFDLYILGIDLRKLNRPAEAAVEFRRCGSISGNLQAQCRSDAAAAAKAPNQNPLPGQPDSNTAVAAISDSPASTPQPAEKVQQLTAANEPLPVSSLPEPPPAANISDIPPPAQQAAPIRAETTVVPIRVVVRDNKGRAVADLKKDNFKLYQDGKLVEISNFTSIVTPPKSTGTAQPNGQLPARAPETPSSGPANSRNPNPAVNDGAAPAAASRFVALFFDDVHLYFYDMVQTVGAAEKLLMTLQPEDRVAIMTASGQGGTTFTSDRDALLGVLKKLKPHPYVGGGIGQTNDGCPPAMTYTEADAIIEDNSPDVTGIAGADFARCAGISLEDARATQAAGEGEAQAIAARTNVAGQQAIDGVLAGLRQSVHVLSAMPGQRTLVLVSPGFLFRGHDGAFADITDLAIHNNVVIDTLDAKGLPAHGAEGKWDPDRFERFGYGHFAVEQPILEELADSTGGMFVKNNNDFAGVLREMTANPETYYLLGYAPQSLQLDGKYHALKVSLTAKGNYTIQARRGFYAPSRLETPEEAAKREIEDALFSNEEQHGLPVKVETSLIDDAPGGPKLNVKTAVDVSHLTFQKAAGVNHENLMVEVALFDTNGNFTGGQQKTVDMNLQDSTLAELAKTGVYVELNLDVKPGRYVLRTVARDSNDGHISAENSNVTVPN